MIKKFSFLLLLITTCSFSIGAELHSPPLTVELIAEQTTFQPGHPAWLGLHLKIADDWHVHWKHSCGEMPITVSWKFPPGVTPGALTWPAPEKINKEGVALSGYHGDLVALMPITIAETLPSGANVEVAADIEWVVCSDSMCQPGFQTIALPLSISDGAPSANAQLADLFAAARGRVPADPSDGVIAALDQPVRAHAALAKPETAFEGGIAIALLFAFLGGMILNLMPCVLPVLSFKVLSLVKIAGQSRRERLKQGALFSLGVVISFWILAGLMLTLRTYGQSVGWGFQLQEPLFVAGLAVLLFTFALSLFGVFELGLSMASLAGDMQLSGSKRSENMQSFFSGVLATAVATPCTGPFLGATVGFAITLPFIQAMSIFTALAAGLCFPYILLALFPGLLRFLPRPGPWMETFKQLMGFFLMATVLWLLWVFSAQTSLFALMGVLGGLLCFAVAAWIHGQWALPPSKAVAIFVRSTSLLFVAAGLGLIAFTYTPTTASETALSSEIAAEWEPYSAERIAELRQQGTPVLIDFTAKWCLICQANHLTLANDAVAKELDRLGVVRMKADWTRNDPRITEALSHFGRNSVPLYVLYGRGSSREPQILPQILTTDIVMHSIEEMMRSDDRLH